jgi:hypothetical protein
MYSSVLAEHCDHTYTQQIHARPERVFPLLCPMREHEWIPEWRARMIHSRTGVAEAGAVFATPAECGETLWIVTSFEPPQRIAFARYQADGVVTLIDIELTPGGSEGSALHVRYRLTASRDDARAAVQAFSSEHWQRMMQRWQDLLNQYFARHTTR